LVSPSDGGWPGTAAGRGRRLAGNDGRLYERAFGMSARFARNAPLAQPQRATFYGGGAAGYTDYPSLSGLLRDPR
jgi:N-ethylmaleimide reductase